MRTLHFTTLLFLLAGECLVHALTVTPVVTLQDVTALRAQNNYYSSGYAAVMILSSQYAGEKAGGLFVAQGKTGQADDGGVYIVDAASVVWERSFSGPVSVLWYGADPTGATASTTAFNQTINYAMANNADVVVPSGHYVLDQGLQLPSKISMNGEGAVTLDFAQLMTGAAITIGEVDSYYYNAGFPLVDIFQQGKLSNMLIIGGNVTTGIFLNGQSTTEQYATPFYTLEKLDIKFFNIGVMIGQQTWLNGLFSCAIQQYSRYGLYISNAANEGEDISIYNSAIFNANNANAIGAYIARGSSISGDVNFYGTSFDYNGGPGLVVASGQARFFGCHFEGDLSVSVESKGYAEFFGCWFRMDYGFDITGGQTNFFGGYLPTTNTMNVTSGTTVNIVDRQT
ncbi:hypothetical protein V1509DRAFT_650509 [Lipomyces kononenkoae]